MTRTGSRKKLEQAGESRQEQLERVCVGLLPCYSINGELANRADRADPLG